MTAPSPEAAPGLVAHREDRHNSELITEPKTFRPDETCGRSRCLNVCINHAPTITFQSKSAPGAPLEQLHATHCGHSIVPQESIASQWADLYRPIFRSG